jgi:hypothetical protein
LQGAASLSRKALCGDFHCGDWIDEMIQAGKRFMIYSPNEAQIGQGGGGYWSNYDGWVDLVWRDKQGEKNRQPA